MKLKAGDRVKFLNEHGGGVVSKVISSNLVHVKIEDGFEIPTMTSELVKVEETGQTASHMFMDNTVMGKALEEESSSPQKEKEEIVYDERVSPLEIFRAKGSDKKGIYLAFVPQEQRWLLTGLLDVYLINYSEYDILFSLFLRKANGAWEGTDYDAVKPNSKVLLDSIEREDIEKWSYGVLQVLYHKDVTSKVLAPVNSTFSFKPAKLYRENVYQDSAFLSEKAFLLIINETATQPVTAEADEKYDEEAEIKVAKPKQPEEVINKHKTSPREAVVDLHIGELVDDYSKMSNTEMLNYQLNYFVRCLESAIRNYITKVIFIHGVGDGVLKSKMLEILDAYENVRVKDASLKKFGYGATEVLIWHSNFA
ncbi:MAG: DUF2027 domain-containing protein [Bacteroidota bacterium]